MNIDAKLQQCTIPFKDFLLKDLAEPEFAKNYLDAAIRDFDVDGNIEIILLVIKNVAQAQGGIENLAKWTKLSPRALTNLLQSEDSLPLDKVLDILSTLKDSFHSKHTVANKGSMRMRRHNENHPC